MTKRAKIILITSISLGVVLILGFCFYLYINKLEIEFQKNLDIQINTKIDNLSLIKSVKHGKVLTKKKNIDTRKLGKQRIKFSIQNILKQNKKYEATINIIDTKKPEIKYNKEITITEGENIDLLKDVKVTDNSKEEISATVEGTYDLKKEGTYDIIYAAKDSSGNETKEKAILIVKKNEDIKPSSFNKSNISKGTNSERSFITSKGFKGKTVNGVTYIDGILIVNKTYPIPSTYAPGGLTKETKNAMDKMIAAARLEGLNVYFSSGFRSYSRQQTLYNNYIARDGKAKADTFSARAGHSEHQSGLAFDVNQINDSFNDTAEAKWLAENSYKYGLILRYPKGKTNETGYKYESWHFRYVGEELATKLYNNGDWITLETYFGITSQY